MNNAKHRVLRGQWYWFIGRHSVYPHRPIAIKCMETRHQCDADHFDAGNYYESLEDALKDIKAINESRARRRKVDMTKPMRMPSARKKPDNKKSYDKRSDK